MTQTAAPKRGTTFTWQGKTWTVTSVAKLPHDTDPTKHVRARNEHGDMIRFGTVAEWLAEHGR